MGIGNGAASLTISSPPIRAAALRCTVNERGAEIYPDAVEWEWHNGQQVGSSEHGGNRGSETHQWSRFYKRAGNRAYGGWIV